MTQDAEAVREARAIVRNIVTAYTGYHTDTAKLARLIVTGLDAHGLLRHSDGEIPGLPNHRLDPESGDYVSEPLRHNDGRIDDGDA